MNNIFINKNNNSYKIYYRLFPNNNSLGYNFYFLFLK